MLEETGNEDSNSSYQIETLKRELERLLNSPALPPEAKEELRQHELVIRFLKEGVADVA